MGKDNGEVRQRDEHPEERDENGHPHDDPAAREPTDGSDDAGDDAVEEASRDSFPSSDPPAW